MAKSGDIGIYVDSLIINTAKGWNVEHKKTEVIIILEINGKQFIFGQDEIKDLFANNFFDKFEKTCKEALTIEN